MRFYLYACWDCGIDIWLTMKSSEPFKVPATAVCPGCWSLVEQDYMRKNVMPDIFDPYVERGLCPQPVEFRTKQHRDELLAQNHGTYDTNLYNRGPTRTPWEKDLTYAKAAAIARGKRAEALPDADLDTTGNGS